MRSKELPPDYPAYHNENNAPENPPAHRIGRTEAIQTDFCHEANEIQDQLQEKLRHSDLNWLRVIFRAITILRTFCIARMADLFVSPVTYCSFTRKNLALVGAKL